MMVEMRVKRRLVEAVEEEEAEPETKRTSGWRDGASGHERKRMSGGFRLHYLPTLFHAPALSRAPSPFLFPFLAHGTGVACSDGGTAVPGNVGDDGTKRTTTMMKRQRTGNWAGHVSAECQNPFLLPFHAHGSRRIWTLLG